MDSSPIISGTAEAAAEDLPPDFLARSRRRFTHFVEGAQRASGPVLVLCHSDADGLAAGAILTLALRRAGLSQVEAVATGKAGSAWSDETRALLAARQPAALIVTDLGVREEPVWDGSPPLFIDHHRPSGLPPDAERLVITGYGLDPVPTSGLLALACAGGLPGVDMDDLDWIAAISVLSDIARQSSLPPDCPREENATARASCAMRPRCSTRRAVPRAATPPSPSNFCFRRSIRATLPRGKVWLLRRCAVTRKRLISPTPRPRKPRRNSLVRPRPSASTRLARFIRSLRKSGARGCRR